MLLAAAAFGPAAAVPLATGSYANSGIGAEFATLYDNFSVAGRALDVPTDPGTSSLVFADLVFEVGPNCYGCTSRPSFDAPIDVTFGGVTHQLDLGYAWSSTGPVDSLTFASIAPLDFEFADRRATLAFDTPAALSGSGGSVYGSLGGTLTVTAIPEPSTWMLMLAGMSVAGWVGRRKA